MSRSTYSNARLTLDQLDERLVPAVGMAVSNSVLTITGDSWHNDVYVSLKNNKVHVSATSLPTSGFILTPDVKTGSFSGVKEIRFFGNGGDDTFDSTFIYPCYLDGGAGNDWLEGGGGNDTIFGGSGNDTLRGVGGNDNLYGGDDSDQMFGGNGLDGLYGGAGSDSLYGGAGADRFLVMEGASEHKDAVVEDAVVRFKNDARTWNASEIVAVDAGLRELHLRTGNDNLLETKSGGTVTFWRGGDIGTTRGTNYGGGKIVLYDDAFTDGHTAGTTIHEIGHNWDAEHSNWNNWLKISGWRNTKPSAADASKYAKATDTDENWWYLKTATFTRDYGKTNPREDFASSWASYFIYKFNLPNPTNSAKLSTAKYNHIDALLNSLK